MRDAMNGALFWRKPFAGEGESIFHLMLRRLGDGLAKLCLCCPCTEWYIVAACPCEDCVQPQKCFVGDTIEGNDSDYFGTRLPLVALTMTDHAPQDSAEFDGQTKKWDCVATVKGCTLWAIKHETRTAPEWDGYLNVVVYVDNQPVKEWDGTTYAPGETMLIGDGVIGQSGYAAVLEVLHDFDIAGDHAVDLRVEFVPDNEENPRIVYTCRTAVRVAETAEDPEIGDVFIVPGWLLEDYDTECAGVLTMGGTPISFTLSVLKGPFKTRDDAEFVYNEWRDLIDAYAATCVCAPDLDPHPLSLNYEFFDEEDENGWGRLARYGTGGDFTSNVSNVQYWQVVRDYDLIGGDDFDVEARQLCDGGTTTLLSTSGSLHVPPCCEVTFWAKPKVENPRLSELTLGGEIFPLGTENGLCVLEDPESEFYGAIWDYDYECNGVPANTVELEHYKANCLE